MEWQPVRCRSTSKSTPVGQVLVMPGARYSIIETGLFWPCIALINAGWRAVIVRWEWNEAAAPNPERFLEVPGSYVEELRRGFATMPW